MFTDKRKVGVVGYGFVGEAVAKGLAPVADVIVYDKAKGWCLCTDKGESVLGWGWVDATCLPPPPSVWDRLVENCPIIFVCVPTPMKPGGACDTSIVRDVVKQLADANQYRRDGAEGVGVPFAGHVMPTIVIKSTVPPGTTARLQEEFRWLNLVFSPEFLTEADSLRDFAEMDRVILGGKDVEKVVALFEEFGRERANRTSDGTWFVEPPTIHLCSSTEAEVVKYLTNCFLAVKVSVANEFAGFCEKIGADWDKVVEMAVRDERLGETHWQVPGPDGHKGFGGTCFPKDLNAAINFMGKAGPPFPISLRGAWSTNLRVRPERDWEQLKGRAVL